MEYIPDEMKVMGITQEPWSLATGEVAQADETGRDVTALRERLAGVTPNDHAELIAIYEAALALPAPPKPLFDASDLPTISAALVVDDNARKIAVGEKPSPAHAGHIDDLGGRMHGAWLGRIIGNLMGKPFEIGPTRDSIRTYLTALDRYPLMTYVPFPEGSDRNELGLVGFEGVTEGRINGGVRDDDLDYTVLGLHLIETYGLDYSTRDVAFEWLSRFPVYQVFTAEHAAYQNLVREVDLADVGEYHNPFREWIGALIRADIFGFIYPGRPRAAALLSYNDAFLSHRSNGIYGEMWAAALVSSAFVSESAESSILTSLEHVPSGSRIAQEVQSVLDDFHAGITWEQAIDALAERTAGMSWVHTINNAGALTAALLWGQNNFRLTIGLAVCAGLDTDSIAATAGAWIGAFLGREGVPDDLARPLRDTYHSGVFGLGTVRISDLADRTYRLAQSII